MDSDRVVSYVVSTHHPTRDWLRQGGSYFTVEKLREIWKGWEVTFWRQPLSATCAEFETAGFVIERLVEPLPVDEMKERFPEDLREALIGAGVHSLPPAKAVTKACRALNIASQQESRQTEDPVGKTALRFSK